MKNIDSINVQELNKIELENINGGDEPAYSFGYFLGVILKHWTGSQLELGRTLMG